MAADAPGEDPDVDLEDDEVELEEDLEDDELEDDELAGGIDEELAEEDDVPEGFTLVDVDAVVEADEGEDADGADAATLARAAAIIDAATRDEDVAAEDDDDDELAVKRRGEFVCSVCHLVKRDTQLARPRLRICRDCA